ncbi:hypothetical protein BGP_6075 [Beggiatoa sp. PS]|nr:hypothetical protein BGP_6075 [Beggiatoa sp. PS]
MLSIPASHHFPESKINNQGKSFFETFALIGLQPNEFQSRIGILYFNQKWPLFESV